MPRQWFPIVLLLGVAAAACGGSPPAPAAAAPTPLTPPSPPATAPVLGASHPGVRNPHCGNCHTPPVAGHSVTAAPACATCHGANEACDPNGRATVRRHAATDGCLSCHPAHHGFTAAADCVSCHFAARGTRVCAPATGPSLPGALATGCFGWPATEFSPANRASVRTFLQAGDRAVEFTLRDTAGTAVTLSALLATRPVLLVHGAFT